MSLTPTQRLILYALGLFYRSLNQPLQEKPLRLRTSKIAFIELLLQSQMAGKQARALYKNLETLESKRLIDYEKRMIRFTDVGLRELEKIHQERQQFSELEKHFADVRFSKRKLQTVISSP